MRCTKIKEGEYYIVALPQQSREWVVAELISIKRGYHENVGPYCAYVMRGVSNVIAGETFTLHHGGKFRMLLDPEIACEMNRMMTEELRECVQKVKKNDRKTAPDTGKRR